MVDLRPRNYLASCTGFAPRELAPEVLLRDASCLNLATTCSALDSLLLLLLLVPLSLASHDWCMLP